MTLFLKFDSNRKSLLIIKTIFIRPPQFLTLGRGIHTSGTLMSTFLVRRYLWIVTLIYPKGNNLLNYFKNYIINFCVAFFNEKFVKISAKNLLF